MNGYFGEIASLAVSVCWVITAVYFTLATKKLGSAVVNLVRLPLAVVFLSLTHLLVQGRLFPHNATHYNWFWLGLSGIIGLALGDALLLESLVWIGTRRSMLILSLAPIIGAALGWFFLGETLSLVEMAAIGLTVGAIAWVVSEKQDSDELRVEPRRYRAGVLLAMGGATCQAAGLLTSKMGMADGFDPLSATLIRMMAGTAAIWLYIPVILARGEGVRLSGLFRRHGGLMDVVWGTVAGPFIGVWLSLIAVNLTRIGIASTLMALPPVLVLFPSLVVFKERLSIQSVLGAAAAVAGVALIFLF